MPVSLDFILVSASLFTKDPPQRGHLCNLPIYFMEKYKEEPIMGFFDHPLLQTSARIQSFVMRSPKFKAEWDSDTHEVRGYIVPWLAQGHSESSDRHDP